MGEPVSNDVLKQITRGKSEAIRALALDTHGNAIAQEVLDLREEKHLAMAKIHGAIVWAYARGEMPLERGVAELVSRYEKMRDQNCATCGLKGGHRDDCDAAQAHLDGLADAEHKGKMEGMRWAAEIADKTDGASAGSIAQVIRHCAANEDNDRGGERAGAICPVCSGTGQVTEVHPNPDGEPTPYVSPCPKCDPSQGARQEGPRD